MIFYIQSDILYIEKRFKYNDFRLFFVKNIKFDVQTIKKKFEKNDFLQSDFFNNSYYLKFNVDSNAKNRF